MYLVYDGAFVNETMACLPTTTSSALHSGNLLCVDFTDNRCDQASSRRGRALADVVALTGGNQQVTHHHRRELFLHALNGGLGGDPFYTQSTAIIMEKNSKSGQNVELNHHYYRRHLTGYCEFTPQDEDAEPVPDTGKEAPPPPTDPPPPPDDGTRRHLKNSQLRRLTGEACLIGVMVPLALH